jgi:hypothetical protein
MNQDLQALTQGWTARGASVAQVVVLAQRDARPAGANGCWQRHGRGMICEPDGT